MTSSASWQLAARHLALDATTVKTIRALHRAGIESLLLKGPVTASRLYAEEPHRRSYGDIDLLVAPGRFGLAKVALDRAGYRPANRGLRPAEVGWQEESWFAPGPDRLVVDLHRTLHGVRDAASLWTALWQDSMAMQLQGVAVAIPNRIGSALIVALHAAGPGGSRQPYRDLTRAAAVFSEAEWAAAVALARAIGAEVGVAAGFAAVPGAHHLLRRHRLSNSKIPLGLRMFVPNSSPAGMAIRRLLMTPGFQARLRYLWSRLYPSEMGMRKNWEVRGSGRRAMVRAHAMRYRRIFLSVPQGLRELDRARRLGRSDRMSWAGDAVDDVRSQLALGGLGDVDLVAPAAGTSTPMVARGLDHRRANCLERSLVWQRFYASRGEARSVIIGVSPPGEHFHAHAWLAGDALEQGQTYEILRRPAPAGWLSQSTVTR